MAIADSVSLGTTIKDVSGGTPPAAARPSVASFGVDTLTVTATDRAPAATTLGSTGTVLLQLSLTADFNQVVVTSVRSDRLGSAFDGDTVAGGAKLYDDLDNDEALDVGEPLLGSGSFASGSVTITIGKAVTAGAPENVLIAVDTNAAGTPAITLGVELATIAFLTVSGGDVVSSAAFPLRSTTTLLAAPAPSLLSATAVDNNAGQPGVQAGDTVALVFDRSTNASAVTAANINTALALNNGHSWLDGDSVIGSAVWSTTTVSNETVPITFSAGTGAPTIAVGDSLTVGAGTIRDVTSANDATGSPPTIGGAFGEDSLTVSAVDLASTNVARGKADAPFLLLTLTAAQNSVVVTQIRVDRAGTAADADTATNGVKLWKDSNSSGSLDSSDTLLATGSFSGGTVNLVTGLAVVSGTPQTLFISLDVDANATLSKTVGITLTASSYFPVAAGDRVEVTNFPLTSGTATIVAPAPGLVGAVASDASGNGQGIQAGDQVILTFDSATNALAITSVNVDTVLALNNSHSWLDGSGAIGTIVWSTTSVSNDTLTITLAAGAAAPTIAVGDTVTIPPGTIWDVTGSNDALGSPPALSGSFGDDVVTVTPTNAAPRIVNEDAGAVTMERLRFTALTNSVVITGLRIDRLGTATDLATSVNGVTVHHDQNADGVLGSGSFVGGTVTITAPLVIASGTTQDVLIVLDITGGAGKTIGVALLNSSYVLVASGDVVANTNFAVLSSITTIAAVSPHLTGAVASGDSAAGEDVHAEDTVTLVFNGPTNGFPITAANIASTLVLNNSHL